MPHQLTTAKAKRQSAVVRSKKMVTAWLCLSASFFTGARAAFVRNSASRKAAIPAGRIAWVKKVALPDRQWLHMPSALSASSAVESKPSEYDLLNKEKELGSYAPSEFEKEIYSWWEGSGCFQPDAKQKRSDNDKKPYVLPMPPPNVTGRLHMGHAMFVALQDVLARFHRMRGRPVLWLPGRFSILLGMSSHDSSHLLLNQERTMLELQHSCRLKSC
jgi:hypothetical protein